MEKFLANHGADKKAGHYPTFTGMGSMKGSWCVGDDDYEEFLGLLHEHIFVKGKDAFGFVEQPRGDGVVPLLVDLDFHYDGDASLRHGFTHDQIRRFLEAYVQKLTTYVDLTDKRQLRFFVTLRPQAYNDPKKGIVKDGIHIECPDMTLLDKHQGFLRGKLLEENIIGNTFVDLEYTNKVEDIYDANIYRKVGWFFYGETKPKTGAYKVELVYKYDVKKAKWSDEPKDKYNERTLMELLSIRYKIAEVSRVKAEHADAVASWVQDQQGRAAAAGAANEPERQLIVAELTEQVNEVMRNVAHMYNSYISPEKRTFIRNLVMGCLSEERATDFTGWMRVGWCLRNIDDSDDMFNLWTDFSRKSHKFNESEVGKMQREWLKGGRHEMAHSLKEGSLHRWAKEDNPTAYKELMENDIHMQIIKISKVVKGGSHYHLAQIVFSKYGDRYKCHVESRCTEWFEFTRNTWRTVPQALQIKNKLSTELAQDVMDALKKVSYPDNMEMQMKEQAQILDIARNLYNESFKENVIKSCVQLFVDDDFHKKMNADPYKIGCANGILHLRVLQYDAHGKEAGYKTELREGTPEDYVSFQAGVCNINNVALEALDYEPYNPADPQIAEIMEFFALIFPNEELREFVLTLAAGCLEGNNIEQFFYIMTGSGGNGKSMFVKLMKYTIGDYASSLSTTTITRKRPDAGAANPDLITIKNRRFIDMAEPDEREQLNTAIIKQLSGGDTLMARGLFKDQEQIKVAGKIFLATNRMPQISSMDGGTWRRIKVIPFMSRFVAAGDPLIDPERNIYEKDLMLDEKLIRWRKSFLSLLVHYYETRYCPHGIKKVPAMVDEYTNEYKSSYDTFDKFLADRVRVASAKDRKPEGSTATVQALLASFKSWQRETESKKLTDSEIKIRLEEKYGKPITVKQDSQGHNITTPAYYQHMRVFKNEMELNAYNGVDGEDDDED
jgi:P4 family phage/plasmid primase-like protien